MKIFCEYAEQEVLITEQDCRCPYVYYYPSGLSVCRKRSNPGDLGPSCGMAGRMKQNREYFVGEP